MLRLICLLLLALFALPAWASPQLSDEAAYAVEYGRSDFPAGLIFKGRAGNVEFGWYVFAIHQRSGWTLIDTGPDPRRQNVPFQLTQELPVRQLLAGLGCQAVQNIILTHGHWDHAGGLGAFPEAQVWMARAEFESMEQSLRDPQARWKKGYLRSDLDTLRKVQEQNRLHLFDREMQLGPSLKVFREGGHTPGMLALSFAPKHGPRLLFIGDNAYLYGNLKSPADPVLKRLLSQFSDSIFLPGHDPAILQRFPAVNDHIVRLDRPSP